MAFTEAKQKAFLSFFAGSCNVADAAARVGVATSTLYARRGSDPAFRAAWAVAQDQAVAALRAELVRRGLELVRAATPDDASLAALGGMDARFLLGLVEAHERNAGKAPGDIVPAKSDAVEAAARLHKLMVRMRGERKRALETKRRQAQG